MKTYFRIIIIVEYIGEYKIKTLPLFILLALLVEPSLLLNAFELGDAQFLSDFVEGGVNSLSLLYFSHWNYWKTGLLSTTLKRFTISH